MPMTDENREAWVTILKEPDSVVQKIVVAPDVTVAEMLQAFDLSARWVVYHVRMQRHLRPDENLFSLLDPIGCDRIDITPSIVCE